MEDMDAEEKAVIDKLQFDDRQKKLGLPQSHELVSCCLLLFTQLHIAYAEKVMYVMLRKSCSSTFFPSSCTVL